MFKKCLWFHRTFRQFLLLRERTDKNARSGTISMHEQSAKGLETQAGTDRVTKQIARL